MGSFVGNSRIFEADVENNISFGFKDNTNQAKLIFNIKDNNGNPQSSFITIIGDVSENRNGYLNIDTGLVIQDTDVKLELDLNDPAKIYNPSNGLTNVEAKNDGSIDFFTSFPSTSQGIPTASNNAVKIFNDGSRVKTFFNTDINKETGSNLRTKSDAFFEGDLNMTGGSDINLDTGDVNLTNGDLLVTNGALSVPTGPVFLGSDFEIDTSGDLTFGDNLITTDVSTGSIGFGSEPNPLYTVQIGGETNFSGNATFGGDVSVNQNNITIGTGNSGDVIDLGINFQYNDGSDTRYTGFYRDPASGNFIFYDNLLIKPSGNVDNMDSSFHKATIEVGKIVADTLEVGSIAPTTTTVDFNDPSGNINNNEKFVFVQNLNSSGTLQIKELFGLMMSDIGMERIFILKEKHPSATTSNGFIDIEVDPSIFQPPYVPPTTTPPTKYIVRMKNIGQSCRFMWSGTTWYIESSNCILFDDGVD